MKSNKGKIITILSLINIPISYFVSRYIHCLLSHSSEMIYNKQFFILFFMIFVLIEMAIYLLFSMNSKSSFSSNTVRITEQLKTPEVVGQGQHGTARWMNNKEFEKSFRKNILFKDNTNNNQINSGGLIVGYKSNKKQEKIYYIDDNIHSLIVGATRSGKTRSIVLQTVGNLGLAGESMIISDPKAEIYHYTSEFLKKQGYKIITLDFKNPSKSSKYNFLQPVIDAVNRDDYRKAEEYAWDITQALVGNEDSKMEKIWRDGEMSVIAGAIMSVVFDNKEHP